MSDPENPVCPVGRHMLLAFWNLQGQHMPPELAETGRLPLSLATQWYLDEEPCSKCNMLFSGLQSLQTAEPQGLHNGYWK